LWDSLSTWRISVAITPLDYLRREAARMADPTHLVITVHGIRTNGDWQDELKKLLEAAEPGVTVRMYRYGFFSSFAFLIPPVRWWVGRQFVKFFENEVRSAPETARIDLVAHSFGTYLAASALRHLPERRKIHTVIFAGSVLPPSFPWYRYLQSGAVGRVINECGWDDMVLLLCQSTALLMGMAGRIGFHGMVGDRFINRYYRWGHGGYFDAQHRFMREEWVPLLTRDGPVTPHDERPRLTAVGGVRLFLLSNMHFIKVAAACLLLMLAIFIPLNWYRDAEYKKQAERINHIALLTNAQEIPGRDPSHVRDLLKIDALASGNENAIDHLIGTEGTSNSRSGQSIDEETEPQWWESLPWMFDSVREGYRARLYHYRANQQLVASNKEAGADSNAKAEADYVTALKSYKRINDNDPAHGSYALCVLDYAQLLAKMGKHKDAIDQFKLVRDGVFPPAAAGNVSSRPTSLEIDSLIMQSGSCKALMNWDDAEDCLQKAIAIAKTENNPALLSDAHNEMAWLHMDRLEVNDARKNFAAAETACRAVMHEQVVYKIRFFHIRHGNALADRLTGDGGEAYAKYRQIVTDLQDLMRDDLTFTPKQRRDLRDRLLNSMERRADVRLFAPETLTTPETAAESSQVVLSAKLPPATSSDDFATVEDDYEEAIELLGNDDLPSKAQLLYKKVIAAFVSDLEKNGPVRTAERRGRHHVLDTIDVEFAEANRTMKTLPTASRDDLKIYHDIAACCMHLRASAMAPDQPAPAGRLLEVARSSQGATAAAKTGCFRPQAVEKLRAMTVKYAPDCSKLNREKVEMLLLAHEILVKLNVEPDRAKRAADATRMMAVLGKSTDVASHEELARYYERFQRIAFEQAAIDMSAIADNRSRAQNRESMRPVLESPEIERFSIQFGPWLQLKWTNQRPETRAVRPSTDSALPQAEALSKMP
jgi:tetratricopeptide (TPR) repeat protein